MKQSKWKEILTSNQMFIVYIIVVLCIAISMKTPAFAEVSTIITLARALLVTLCFAICEMVVIISGGIDVSFPAIACASLYIPICVFKENDIDNVVLAFVFAAAIGLVIGIASDSAVDCYSWCEQYYTGHASYVLWHQTDLKTAKYDCSTQ